MKILMVLVAWLMVVEVSSTVAEERWPRVVKRSDFESREAAVEALERAVDAANLKRFEAKAFAHGHRWVRYRWYAPAGFTESEALLPLVIFLHGSSGKGDDNITQLTGGSGALGAGVWATPESQAEHPAFVLAPQCPSGEMWTWTASWTSQTHPLAPEPAPALAGVMALLEELLRAHPIDPDRIYLVGGSMGGYGTWDWLVREASRFAAAIPVCGGMPEGQAAALKQLPLWMFHGEHDGIVPVEESRRAFQQIRALGGAPRYTEYAEGPHRISGYVWSDPEVRRWLFAQKRQG